MTLGENASVQDLQKGQSTVGVRFSIVDPLTRGGTHADAAGSDLQESLAGGDIVAGGDVGALGIGDTEGGHIHRVLGLTHLGLGARSLGVEAVTLHQAVVGVRFIVLRGAGLGGQGSTVVDLGSICGGYGDGTGGNGQGARDHRDVVVSGDVDERDVGLIAIQIGKGGGGRLGKECARRLRGHADTSLHASVLSLTEDHRAVGLEGQHVAVHQG